MLKRARFCWVGLAMLLGCGGSPAPLPTSPLSSAADKATAEARLKGAWRLVEYRPEVPPEATLQGMLNMEVQTMVVRFDKGRMTAESSTIHVDWRYEIGDAGGQYFKAVTSNASGDRYTMACQFSDDSSQIFFHGETEPWRGYGTLRRSGP